MQKRRERERERESKAVPNRSSDRANNAIDDEARSKKSRLLHICSKSELVFGEVDRAQCTEKHQRKQELDHYIYLRHSKFEI